MSDQTLDDVRSAWGSSTDGRTIEAWLLDQTYVGDLLNLDLSVVPKTRHGGPVTAQEIHAWRDAYLAGQPLPAAGLRVIQLKIRGYNRGYLTVDEACKVIRDLREQVEEACTSLRERAGGSDV